MHSDGLPEGSSGPLSTGRMDGLVPLLTLRLGIRKGFLVDSEASASTSVEPKA